MLTKIIINNFKSFNGETTIDFTRTNYKVLEENVSNDGVLKGMMFVGPNASGKSNTLLAIRLLLDELFLDMNFDSGFLRCLFCKSLTFSIDYYFLIKNNEINYFFEFDIAKGVLSEKLYVNKKLQLERLGSTAKSYITEKKNYNEIDQTRLFLRTIYFNTGFANNSILIEWFRFLQNSVYFNAFDKQITSYGKKDLKILNYVKENDISEINSFFDEYNFEQTVHYLREIKGDNLVISLSNEGEKDIFFKRKGLNIPIPFQFESLGNQTLLNMLPAFLQVAKNNGIFLADEFSSGFHNELERLVIKYFMKQSTDAQMIFVSHSTNLLSTSILRPDQVYAVEFAGNEGSKLKRFSDEQPRVSQNMEKMYLSGVFGGLPNYKDAYDEN